MPPGWRHDPTHRDSDEVEDTGTVDGGAVLDVTRLRVAGQLALEPTADRLGPPPSSPGTVPLAGQLLGDRLRPEPNLVELEYAFERSDLVGIGLDPIGLADGRDPPAEGHLADTLTSGTLGGQGTPGARGNVPPLLIGASHVPILRRLPLTTNAPEDAAHRRCVPP